MLKISLAILTLQWSDGKQDVPSPPCDDVALVMTHSIVSNSLVLLVLMKCATFNDLFGG